eukprot:12925542-Prorocentrum_lima.AAC.1
MLCNALEQIYKKEEHARMNLSEVQTFYSIELRDRWYDRDPVCSDRTECMDKANRPFKAVVIDHDLPK